MCFLQKCLILISSVINHKVQSVCVVTQISLGASWLSSPHIGFISVTFGINHINANNRFFFAATKKNMKQLKKP